MALTCVGTNGTIAYSITMDLLHNASVFHHDCTPVNILLEILHYGFARCYYWGKLEFV